ncbi:MAG: MFS transporter [Cytophagaceae bacterium]
MKRHYLTRTVVVLSAVSLLTDVSSEMLYPVMPVFLQHIGFSVAFIGILEGFAEAVAGLSKGYFAGLSDQFQRRRPFIAWGYFLSAISKPMIAAILHPAWIFFSRTTDRVGKGLRSGARDALLTENSNPEDRGKVFGFHRAMDTVGAAIGPIIALLWLYFNPESYRTLFVVAFIPALLGVVLTFLIKEGSERRSAVDINYSFFSFMNYWRKSPSEYKRLVIGLLLFGLFNSSDVFILLILKYKGVSDYDLIILYVFYNLVYAIFSFPFGIIADRTGMKITFISGLFLFSCVYGGLALSDNFYAFWVLLFIYGMYAALTEGVSKGWISIISGKDNKATAFGFYSSLLSVTTILASSMAGLLWEMVTPAFPFYLSAVAVIILIIYFIFATKPGKAKSKL